MQKHWYLSRNGQVFGPVTDAQLFESVAAGKVLSTDLLNVAGEPEWVVANTVPGLFLVNQEPVLAELEDDGPVVADVIEESRVEKATCLACFREVSITIMPGVATAHCPRCRAVIDTGETAAQPAHQAAFAKLESPAAFKKRMQQKVVAAKAASARDGAIIGGILGGIVPQ